MSSVGQSYDLGTFFGPDSRFVDDLAAIDEYVKGYARSRVSEFPGSLPLIEDYEKWRQDLGWTDMSVFPNDTMNSAKAKRDGINAAQKNVTPADRNVEEGSFITPPPDSTKELMSTSTKLALYAGGAFAGVLLVAAFVAKMNPLALVTRMVKR